MAGNKGLDSIKDEKLKKAVIEELKRQERRRKAIITFCIVAAIGCFGYFFFYQYMAERTEITTTNWAEQIRSGAGKGATVDTDAPVIVHKTGEKEAPPVLEKFVPILKDNKSVIGWLSIPGTDIDYPVMQTQNNDYYLTHNFNQQYDKNGSIFLDANCDVIDRPTNLIIYGHHMKSGKMFGSLDAYANEDYYKSHQTFQFDTIYEEGTYAIAYVFRSQVYAENEITFKYYQFINANSEAEFYSNMQAMADMSLYQTGVVPQYGDELVTLSTCDRSQTAEGRFVVVGVKIS